MLSPFPGMDPYIEAPRIWSDFHGGLASEIRAVLNRDIRPCYFAALIPYPTHVKVEVTHNNSFDSTVPLELPLELFSVEIRTVGDEVLITSIEILSPVNKQRGHDAHLDYLRKRRDLLRSAAHLVEIDLLRGGVRPPLQQAVPLAPYYVMLSRATQRPHVAVWPIALTARLPVLPIPLLEPDPDVLLDLGAVVASVYERGGYDARIDYRTPVPPPALAEQETAWVEQLLAPIRQSQ
ncbi:MAG: DUF4058 family protein [Caldilineaceae bacterium]